MKTIALILSLLLLTSCSNPDTSGGVTLSRGGGDNGNEFPYGDCRGSGYQTHSTFWIVTGSMVYVLTLYLCRLPVHRFFEREKS